MLASFAVTSAALAGLGGVAQANPYTWNSTTGLWGDTSRWSPVGTPGASDDVTINSATAQVSVKNSNQAANSILINSGTFIIDGQTFTLGSSGTSNGAFTLQGNFGNLAGAGTMTLNGTSTWAGLTTMSGTGKTIVSSTGTLAINADANTKTLQRNLDNFGAITFAGNNTAFNFTNATITNKSSGTFTTNANLGQVINFSGQTTSGSFVNEGTFINKGQGTVTFFTGAASVSFVNNGFVDVQAGTLALQVTATHAGDFSVTSGATLRFDAGQTFSATSDLVGLGTGLVWFNNTATNTFGGSLNLANATFNGGSNTFNGSVTVGSFQANTGGTYNFNGTASLGSALFNNALVAGSGDISITGTSNWSGTGTLSGTGKLTIANGGTFNINAGGTPKNLQRWLVNQGTVNWLGSGSNANLNLTNALLENKLGATFNVGGSNYAMLGASGTNAFTNAGVFNKTLGGSATFGGTGAAAVSFANSGTLTLSAGLLQFDGAFGNTGNISITGGATMTANAGFNNSAGLISINNSTLNLNAALTTAQLGNWANTGGQVNLSAALNNAGSTLTLTGTTGALRLTSTNSALVGGTLATTGTGRFEIVAASTFDGVTTSGPVNVFQSATLTIANGLTLGGVLTLDATTTSLVNFQGSQSIGGTGQITTAGGTSTAATVAASTGATLTIGPNVLVHAGTRDLTVGSTTSGVINQGTMSADASGRLLTLAGTAVQNLGTFQAQNGGTLYVSGALTNLSNGALTGGAWTVASNSTLRLGTGSITSNAAVVVLEGPGSNIYTGASGTNDALAQFATNAAGGDFRIVNGRNLTSGTTFTNSGLLTIGAGSTWTTATQFTNSGTVTASGTLNTGKTIDEAFFTLSGGTHTTTGDFTVGSAATNARYDLSGGLLSVGGFATVGAGPSGAGVFNQTAGTLSVAKQLYVSTAGTNTSTFNLSGGGVAAGEFFVGFFNGSKGIVNQTGGDVTLTANSGVGTTGALTLGYSSLNTTSGTYNLSNGTLTDQAAMIGYAGASTFNHSGGTHTVSGSSGAGLNLSLFGGGTATYSMSNGATLVVAAGENVGLYGNGTFNQTGGVHTVGASLVLGVNAGAYGVFNLSGGSLYGRTIDLRRGAFNFTGGTIDYQNFLQEGGDFTGTLPNAHQFFYSGGQFNGRLINTGTVNLQLDFTASDGVDNRAGLAIASDRAVTLNGMGLIDDGAMTLAGTLNSTTAKVASGGDGTFTQSSGTHAVSGNLYVGFAAGRTGSYALQTGTLTVTGTTHVGYNGAGTLTQSGGAHSTAALMIAAAAGSSGTYTMSYGVVTAASTTNNGAFNQSGGTATLGIVTGTGSVSVTGGTLAATSLRQNSLAFSGNAIVNFAVGGGVSSVKTLGLPAPGDTAALNIANNTLLVDYTGGSVVAQVQAAVASGSAASWTGPGIRSSVAAGDSTLGIAVAEAADVLHISGAQTATFQGETVDATTVLVRLTKLGDTNLDGTVSFGDFQRFEQNFGQATSAGWRAGDFNYDGVVDFTDFVGLYGNFGQTVGAPAAPVAASDLVGLTMFANSVPEPSGVGALAIAGAATMLRRSRRRPR